MLLELSRDAEGKSRLLTTNFDTLFEQSWLRHHGKQLSSHACQAMPPPGSSAYGGILHIHGRIVDCNLDLSETDLVLTSAEFGDAYLRNGWASRYIYDLARSQVLVLVGYQADDPPMRYLLEALEADRERYPDLKPVFSFVGVEPDKEEKEKALWYAKGIRPIIYHIGADQDHTALYDTLHEWNSYAENPSQWRKRRLSRLFDVRPATASAEQLDEIVSLLGHGDAERLLGDLAPSAAWWPVLQKLNVFTNDRVSPGAWIAAHVDDAEMIRACAEALPSDERTWWSIDRALQDRREMLKPEWRAAWRLIRKSSENTKEPQTDWSAFRQRVLASEVGYDIRSAVSAAVRPRLRTRRPFQWPDSAKTEGRPDDEIGLVHIDFQPWGDVPEASDLIQQWPSSPKEIFALLTVLSSILVDALEEADDAGYLSGVDQASLDVRSVSPHQQNEYGDGFLPIIQFVADLWGRVAETDPTNARRISSMWKESRFLLMRRLHLHALAHPNVHNGVEASAGLQDLEDQAFWSSDLRRESMRLMAERWISFEAKDRMALLERICGGPPRSLFADQLDEDERESFRDHQIHIRLARVCGAGGELDAVSKDMLEGIQRRHPKWVLGPEDLDDFSAYWRSIGNRGPRGDTQLLQAVPDAELVAKAMRLQAEQQFEQGELWRLLCEADPERAFRGLESEASLNRWSEDAWRSLLWAAKAKGDPAFQQQIAALLLRMPDDVLFSISSSAAQWLRERRKAILVPEGFASSLFLRLWDRLADVVYAADGTGEEPFDKHDLVTEALNHAGGVLTWSLHEALSDVQPAAGSELDEIFEPRFDRLVAARGKSGLLARAFLARQLPWLHHVAPAWTIANLVPRFRVAEHEAAALWQARLRGTVFEDPNLFNALKTEFLSLFGQGAKWNNEALFLVQNLLGPGLWSRSAEGGAFQITPAEVKHALAISTEKVRREAATLLLRWMKATDSNIADRGERWRQLIGPYIKDIWPLDVACRQADVSRALTQLALECENAFPDAVDAIADLLVPLGTAYLQTSLGAKRKYQQLARDNPRAFLKLLNAIVAPSAPEAPRDLAEVLDACVEVVPNIMDEPGYRRLRGIARRRDA